MFLAEQNQAVALRLADRGYVIDNGAISYHVHEWVGQKM